MQTIECMNCGSKWQVDSDAKLVGTLIECPLCEKAEQK